MITLIVLLLFVVGVVCWLLVQLSYYVDSLLLKLVAACGILWGSLYVNSYIPYWLGMTNKPCSYETLKCGGKK